MYSWIEVPVMIIKILYINTGVLLENTPLAKFIRNCIRDLSGIFSISSLVKISMTSFPTFSRLFVFGWFFVYIIKKNYILAWITISHLFAALTCVRYCSCHSNITHHQVISFMSTVYFSAIFHLASWSSYMNSVKCRCCSWVLVAQWIECPPCVREVTGLIPVRDSDISLSHAHVMLINSSFIIIIVVLSWDSLHSSQSLIRLDWLPHC